MAPSTHRLDVSRPAPATRAAAGREAGRFVALLHRMARLLSSDRVLPYLFVAPAVLLVFALTIYPTIYVLRTSFTDWNLMRTVTRAVGFRNYVDLATDELARRAFLNTALFLVGSLAIILGLGLALALALNQPVRGRTFFRSAVVLPWALTAVVVGVMWRWILMPDIGIVNYWLAGLGVNIAFFLSPGAAMATMILVEVWRSTGYGMILVLAGLQGIDGTLYEAARIDGAGFWRALRHITLPLLVPTLLVATILLSIRAVNLIDIPLVVTGGGPARLTETLGLYMWKESFAFHHIGYGSAVAMVMFAINLVLTVLYIRSLSQDTR
jgi:putative chitobiose transport system permease protein